MPRAKIERPTAGVVSTSKKYRMIGHRVTSKNASNPPRNAVAMRFTNLPVIVIGHLANLCVTDVEPDAYRRTIEKIDGLMKVIKESQDKEAVSDALACLLTLPATPYSLNREELVKAVKLLDKKMRQKNPNDKRFQLYIKFLSKEALKMHLHMTGLYSHCKSNPKGGIAIREDIKVEDDRASFWLEFLSEEDVTEDTEQVPSVVESKSD